MTILLGRDIGDDAYARFGGRLFAGTIVRDVDDAVTDPTNITSTPQSYTCDAYAFGYKQEYVDGQRVRAGDYQVTILRRSIAMSNDDAVRASLDLAGVTTHVDTVVEAIAEGAGGNEITVELVVPGTPSFPILPVICSIEETGTNVRLNYLSGVCTVAALEALIATSTLIRIRTAGTPGAVLDGDDALGATALAGGADATSTPVDFMLAPGDRVTVPPPGQSVAVGARVLDVELATEAQVTVHVRGPKAA